MTTRSHAVRVSVSAVFIAAAISGCASADADPLPPSRLGAEVEVPATQTSTDIGSWRRQHIHWAPPTRCGCRARLSTELPERRHPMNATPRFVTGPWEYRWPTSRSGSGYFTAYEVTAWKTVPMTATRPRGARRRAQGSQPS